MAQNYIMIDGNVIFQPDKDMKYNLESTYSADTTRAQDGVMYESPVFTVESWEYTASGVPIADATQILQLITGRRFTLYCFKPYIGAWTNTVCYVGKGSMDIGTLQEGNEKFSSISFNMIGVNPVC